MQSKPRVYRLPRGEPTFSAWGQVVNILGFVGEILSQLLSSAFVGGQLTQTIRKQWVWLFCN